MFAYLLSFFLEVKKSEKAEKQERRKLLNKRFLGLESEDEEPPLKKSKFEVSHEHLDSTFTTTKDSISDAPVPEYSFTKGKFFYCVWWNMGQKDFKCHFTETGVNISFSLPKLTIADLAEILGNETTMNLPTSHEVRWRYELPPETKLELSKETLRKIETESFFGFCGKIVHVLPELSL